MSATRDVDMLSDSITHRGGVDRRIGDRTRKILETTDTDHKGNLSRNAWACSMVRL